MRKWTIDELKNDALKYKTRNEWRKSSSKYQIALKRDLMDECCAHMVKGERRKPKWTPEMIKKEALKFTRRSEWKNKSKTSFTWARQFGIRDECCSHMPKIHKNRKWTFEKIYEHALKYTSRKQWNINHKPTYEAARIYGYLDECCVHMKRQTNPYIDDIGTIYAFTFNDNTAYVGLSIKPEKRYNGHMIKGPVYKKISKGFKFEYKIVENGIPLANLSDKEIFYMEKFKSDGYVLLNVRRGGSLGSMENRITDKEIYETATLFKHKTDWMYAHRNHYDAARRRKLLNDVCKHMLPKPIGCKYLYLIRREHLIKTGRFITFDDMKQSASKFKHKTDWAKEYPKHYYKAKDEKIIAEVCSHMTRKPIGCKISNDEIHMSALQYQDKKEWRLNCPKLYTMACKRKIFTTVCAHMEKL